jgi:oligoribonuclease NrnB/cAMP/cGMP phosphodiesterase (DHH superfamily)
MSLPIEKLQALRTCISHDVCADGTASAMIIKAALPDIEVRFIRYNSEEHEKLEATEGMLFCDFAPHKTRTKDFFDKGAIVLDHHAPEVVAPFGELGVFADKDVEPGVSGAMLAYRHVWVPLHGGGSEFIRDFASICGIYDTWQTKSPFWNKSRACTETLHFFPKENWLSGQIFPGVSGQIFPTTQEEIDTWNARMGIGEILIEQKDSKVKKILTEAYRTNVGSFKIIITEGTSAINEVAEASGEEADIVAGFRYYLEDNSDREDWGRGFPKNAKLKVSLRSRKDYNVRDVALHYGGGGHVKAASYVVQVKSRDCNPYTAIEDHILSYLNGGSS